MRAYLILGTWLPEVAAFLDFVRRAEMAGGSEEAGEDWLLVSPADFPRPRGEGWQWAAPGEAVALEAPVVFFQIDPRGPLIRQAESYADLFQQAGLDLSRWLTLGDMEGIENEPELARFYEIALYYSDVFLLGHRASAGKKFIRDFEKRIDRACLPLLRAWLKKEGKVDEPELVLYPESRRLAPIFGELPEPEGEVPVTGSDIITSWEEGEEDPELARDEALDLKGEVVTKTPDVTRFIGFEE